MSTELLDITKKLWQSGKMDSVSALNHRETVQDDELQGTDVLADGPVLGHDENVLILENRNCGQCIGDPDGRRSLLSSRRGPWQHRRA